MIASTIVEETIRGNNPIALEPYTHYGNTFIGYGHKLHDGPDTINDKRITWSVEHSGNILKLDITSIEQWLNEKLGVPVNQNQFDAIVIIGFNDKPRAEKIVSAMNSGDYEKLHILIGKNRLFYEAYPQEDK